MPRSHWKQTLIRLSQLTYFIAAAALVFGCDHDPLTTPEPAGIDRTLGTTDFISADGSQGQEAPCERRW